LDASGAKEWEASFGQELSQEFQLPSVTFICWLVRQTLDGEYVVIGVGNDEFRTFQKPFMITLDHQGHRISGQLIVEKAGKFPYLDRNGNLVWLTSLGLQSKEVVETSDSGYIIVGKFPQSMPDSNTHMIKTNEKGSYVWDRNLCLDKNIQQAWKKEIVCSYNTVMDVIESKDGGFAMTGGTWLLKTDTNGNIEWIQSYSQEFSDHIWSLIQMADGGFLIAGEKHVDKNQLDGMLIKTDSAGNLQWSRTIGGDQEDRFIALEQVSNDEIIIMGWTESFGEGSSDIWLLAFESTILR
jgi:hypothetical protein